MMMKEEEEEEEYSVYSETYVGAELELSKQFSALLWWFLTLQISVCNISTSSPKPVAQESEQLIH